MPIDRFNEELRRDLSVELFDDLIQQGCIISGSYVLRALTNGQSNFEANDIDIYCTDAMFSRCASLHRRLRADFIAFERDSIGYAEPRFDIENIVAIKSYAYIKGLPSKRYKRWQMIRQLQDATPPGFRKIQFIILQNSINIREWIANTFDISFLISVWHKGRFSPVDSKELAARTGLILPSYIDGLEEMPPRRIWLTMMRIVKYTKRGFRIANVNAFTERVMDWFERATAQKLSELAHTGESARIE